MRDYGYKSAYVRQFRAIVDPLALRLPLPRVNPSLVSALSVLTSAAFVLVLPRSHALALLLLLITISLDWCDGLIAKKYGLCSREGYLVDLVSDRVSEAILFLPFAVPWLYLFLLNSALTGYSIARHRHVILPLRQVFLVVLLLEIA